MIIRNQHLIPTDPTAPRLARAVEEMDSLLDRARDRRDPDVYVGKCDGTDIETSVVDGKIVAKSQTCGRQLYTRIEDESVKCPQCKTEHMIAELKVKLLAAVNNEWARPVTIAAALTSLGRPVLVDTIYKWAQRARDRVEGTPWPDDDKTRATKWKVPPRPARAGVDLMQVGIDDEGRALYRVGDVRARVEAGRLKTVS